MCIDQRSLTDIIWSCFTTIFACTWLSVHPNMPGPDEKCWKTVLRRLELMLWSLICPEMIICWACRQWFAARSLCDEYGGLGWTKTHGYFLQMGGFMLMDGDEMVGVLTPEMFRDLLQDGMIAFPSITEEEIEDRSKADGLAKGIAVLQTVWFIAQCISRKAQGLITTEVELITLAFAALNGILYFLWWNKPLDVKCCVPVPYEDCEPVMIPSYTKPKRLTWRIFGMFFKSPGPEESTARETAKVPHSNPKKSTQIFSSIFSWGHTWFLNSLGHLTGCAAMDTITLATTCALFVKKALVELLLLPFRAILVILLRFQDFHRCDMVDEDAIRVPTFYAPANDDHGFFRVRITTLIVATIFGGIHCAGWNFPFPSHAELIIWRVSSLIIVIVPWTFVPLLVTGFMGIDTIATKVYTMVSYSGAVIYVLARLTLFVEALTALRHLPPGAYAVVEWTALLLHM
ncbi:uncharacterized protein LACBIDRAFT_316764 [Laccaria bicolor S238N-H82]|uniref:Predicted protein n=1 Tax=Laccaria bicolor (strain S238N-H82 / ATCC MYA-4686) TaxID=486041 RepID=B0E1K5_LACBS|nr:uncharacterized protein LACBIDRAFT_316764 [Laccaria bicolor S238N-H82]EDQ99279.1 predicted protein [Laccaria bicolor S238N-H82]|eukprot:XP_001890089.1 predicted protein [Laccaria bicolor S238N-H82]